jgi:secreted trypsin-like serine protease
MNENLFLELQHCGTNEELYRIVIPSANVGLWPWMGSIGYLDGDKKWVHKCGATLITLRHALTAAHCAVDER